jgi:hypothetical protein
MCVDGGGVIDGSISEEVEDEYPLELFVEFGFEGDGPIEFETYEAIPERVPAPGGSMLLLRGGYCG